MSSRRAHGLALAMAAAALAMMTWGVGRPALWLDESASVVATQRTWSDLWVLLGGTDAPLVPYYALLKVTSAAVITIAPASVTFPEVLFRWPSVAAAVLAVWALTLWLARRYPPVLPVATGALLLAMSPLSRYAQEARPYAFVVAAAVAATILWTRLSRDPRRRSVVLYAVAVAALVVAHLLAASLVLAHLVAAVSPARRPDRWSVVLRTSRAAALGLLLAAPLAVPAALQGQGPRLTGVLPASVPPSLVATLGVGGVLTLGLAVGSALAVFVAWTARPAYRFVARLAVAWAVAPLLVLFPLVLLRPNLLVGRYFLVVLPGWALIGGLALVALLDLVGQAVAGLARPSGLARAPLRTAVTYAVGVLVLVGVFATQLDPLRSVRSSTAHGDDIRPVLALANADGHAQLPVVISPPKNALQVGAYAPEVERRLVGVHIQRNQPTIWSSVDTYPSRKQQLSQHDRVVLLLKESSLGGDCPWTPGRASAAGARRCLPRPFQSKAYRVETVEADGGWIFAVLSFHPPTCGSVRCDP